MPDVEVYLSPFRVYSWKTHFKLPTMDFKEIVRRTGGDSTIRQILVDGKYLGTDETFTNLESPGEPKSQLTQL